MGFIIEICLLDWLLVCCISWHLFTIVSTSARSRQLRPVRWIANLDVSQLILIISIYSSCDTISRNSLRDASFICINQLVLSSIVFFMLMQRVTANLNLTAVNINLSRSCCVSLSSFRFRLFALHLRFLRLYLTQA
jgi:hypothetical protein